MLRGYRNLELAVSLSLCCAIAAYGRADAHARRNHSQDEPRSEYSASSDMLSLKQSVDSVASAVEALAEKPESPESKEQAKENLRAAQKSAFWAMVSAIAAGLGFVVSVAGLIFVIRTVKYTKEAVIHAGTQATQALRSADAAIQSIEVTRDLGRRQSKAYVFVTAIEVQNFGVELSPIVAMRVQNTGQTPAYDVQIYGNAIICGFEEIDKVVTNFSQDISTSNLGPDEFTMKHEVLEPLTVDDIQGLTTGTLALFAYGEIRFVDAYKERRFSRYRYFTGGPAGVRSRIIDEKFIVDMHHHNTGNATSENSE